MINGIPYFTTLQAAEIAGLSQNGIIDAVARGVLKSRRRGRIIDVEADSLRGYMDDRSKRKAEQLARKEADLKRKASRLAVRPTPQAAPDPTLPFTETDDLLRQVVASNLRIAEAVERLVLALGK